MFSFIIVVKHVVCLTEKPFYSGFLLLNPVSMANILFQALEIAVAIFEVSFYIRAEECNIPVPLNPSTTDVRIINGITIK